MATYTEIYTLKNSATLRNRVAVAISKAAEDIRNEAAATANHAERFVWAIDVLSNPLKPEQEAGRAMWMILQNVAIQESGEAATDSDLQFVINSLVEFLAGIDTAQ